ncbi:hypothetical protein [Chryseobacterium hagamense]|uniref:Outer membrane protein beta-barrel domain-containing protein n=1 Tax=Chryseobacterium hagamense TaxID=395935 RepID=A0A511YH42_9FLAO|nr:hypothetical protein [Chryseobacterium hagamense]GEN74527.1 hypothetical protein CHA01nite_02670 [Chryseobacterium hagamense]
MKKLSFGFAISAGLMCFAQEQAAAAASPVRSGIKAGLNVSAISSDDTKTKAGIYGGVSANSPVVRDSGYSLKFCTAEWVLKIRIIPA